MPTRYLKPGIRDSDRIESLADCPDAECLYTRLLVTVDDFGRFDGRPEMIKAHCFPIRNRATADTCMQWLKRLENADLITMYVVDGKRYLQIKRWDNKPRASESKYPDQSPSANNCIQGAYTCMQMLPVTVTVTETKTVNPLSGKPDAEKLKINGKANYYADAMDVLNYLNNATGKGFDFKNRAGELTAGAEKIIQRLKQGYTPTELREVVFSKCQQWGNDEKMAEYLRPSTLFGKEKFEQYIGELKNAVS